MGIFGETPEERKLSDQLAETEAELAITRGEANSARESMAQLDGILTRERSLRDISEVAERALAQAETSGDVQISAAQTAEGVVKERYIGGATAVIADKLITEQGDAIKIKRGPHWDEQIKDRLTQQYTDDGTFDRIHGEVDARDIKAFADEMRASAEQERVAYNESDDRRNELHENARKELEDSGDIESIRAQKDKEAEDAWRETALDEVYREIDEQEAAREQDFKDKWKSDWRESRDGQDHRSLIARKLERDWKGRASEEVGEEIKDEELKKLLTERAVAEKKDLEAEAFYREHLKAFEHSGVDVTKLPTNSILTIYLGSLEKSTKKDSYGNNREDGVRVAAQRILKLTKLDDGRFRVEYDSMNESASPQEAEAALRYGEIIHIGRRVTDKDVVNLEPTLRQGVPLFTDDDTTDQRITPTHLKVCNIEVDGASAVVDIKKPRILKTTLSSQ